MHRIFGYMLSVVEALHFHIKKMKTILLLFFCTTLLAQKSTKNTYNFGCNSGFYQLIKNQLHELSADARGQLIWVPILPVFERRLTAIGYCLEDDFMYSLDSATHDLVRIYKSGALLSLGVPTHEKTKERLNANLTIGEMAGNIFCAYSEKEKLLYWIDIQINNYSTTPFLIKGGLLNLAYSAKEQILYTLGIDGWIYTIDPSIKITTKTTYFRDAPIDAQAKGNLWVTKGNRLFATRKNGAAFYELNEMAELPYQYKGILPATIGDGTSCSEALPPIILDNNLMEWRADLPVQDRIKLHWIGVHEDYNDYYVVEHSTDHQEWQQCDWKPSAHWALYENPYGSYSRYVMNKNNYYRLKIIQDNGSASYTRTLFLNNNSNQKNILISPQIALQNASLALYCNGYQNQLLDIKIYNQYGVLVREKSQFIFGSEMTVGLDINGLEDGMYLVKVIVGEEVKRERVFLMGNG